VYSACFLDLGLQFSDRAISNRTDEWADDQPHESGEANQVTMSPARAFENPARQVEDDDGNVEDVEECISEK